MEEIKKFLMRVSEVLNKTLVGGLSGGFRRWIGLGSVREVGVGKRK